jgi:hypothetical protein
MVTTDKAEPGKRADLFHIRNGGHGNLYGKCDKPLNFLRSQRWAGSDKLYLVIGNIRNGIYREAALLSRLPKRSGRSVNRPTISLLWIEKWITLSSILLNKINRQTIALEYKSSQSNFSADSAEIRIKAINLI